MNAYALLRANPKASREQIVKGHGGQPLPLRRPPADPRGHLRGRRRRREVRHDRERGIDRRELIKSVGGGIVVLLVGGPSTLLGQRRPYPSDLNAYLRIGADGRVTVLTGKIEMGQGVMTSQAQMVAEELRVPLDAVDMVMGDTARCPWDMGTFGSLTTRMFGPHLLLAAAEARTVLLRLAAARLGVPARAGSWSTVAWSRSPVSRRAR